MRKKQDTKIGKSVEDLKFELIVDDLLIYDILLRKRPI
jgi:hypothetical protein